MDDAKTVWCGNLSDKVTEELLFELFLQAAPLERVKIPTDKEGRKSTFAFVTFKHEQSVDYALQLLNGVRLYDKNLNVKPRNSNSNNTPRFLERNLSYNNSPSRFGNNQQNKIQLESRDNRQPSRSFRDNYREDRYRESPYKRHDDRDRDKQDASRRKYNYNDRRNSFNDRQNNRRGNRYY